MLIVELYEDQQFDVKMHVFNVQSRHLMKKPFFKLKHLNKLILVLVLFIFSYICALTSNLIRLYRAFLLNFVLLSRLTHAETYSLD